MTATSHGMSTSGQLLEVLRAEIELHVPAPDLEAQGFCSSTTVAAITDQNDRFQRQPFVGERLMLVVEHHHPNGQRDNPVEVRRS